MKAARTYVFVPIPVEPAAHTRVAIALRASSNGGSLPNQKHDDKTRWRARNLDRCKTEALPNHLFWTWFVDNP